MSLPYNVLTKTMSQVNVIDKDEATGWTTEESWFDLL
jgi:hypothetical protein